MGLVLLPGGLAAQSIVSAGVAGRVTGEDSRPIPLASVTVINGATGERWIVHTDPAGKYLADHLSVGSDYRIEVRAIGFQPVIRTGVMLALGQRYTVDVRLLAAAQGLAPIEVRSEPRSAIEETPGGPVQTISESTLTRLPIQGRDFFAAALLSPIVTRTARGGLSIAGQPEALNALTLDGTTANNLLTGATTAGAALGARVVPIEIIDQLQIVTAPFDVRFGSFAAGLINAVTKSGDKEFRASVFGYGADRALVGRDPSGSRGEDFINREVGFTVSGPIVRNRASFFVEGGLQRHTVPQDVPILGTDSVVDLDPAIGIRYSSARRFQSILHDRYGIAEPGSIDPYPAVAPAENVFAKVTLHPGANSRWSLSHEYSRSAVGLLTFTDFGINCRFAGEYCLGSAGFRVPQSVNTTRVNWTGTIGRGVVNEATIARLRLDSRCERAARFPQILVGADGGTLIAGAAVFCGGDPEHQQSFELTDDVSLDRGSHHFTFGTHDELLSFATAPPFGFASQPQWFFDDLDALDQGRPSGYMAVVPSPARPTARSTFGVVSAGLYAQDRWELGSRLTATIGLRVDVPFARERPVGNSALASSSLGLDNTRTPSGQPLWSPRLGLLYQAGRDGATTVRAGIGWFAGRPPFSWFNEVYAHTGLDAVALECFGPAVPQFTVDLAHQPDSCLGGASPAAGPINVFDPAFHFPRNLKLALGAERRLASGWVGSVDLLFTRGVDQFDLIDRNLRSIGAAAGEAGRPLYGVVDPDGRSHPARIDDQFGQVLELRNGTGDRALVLSAMLRRRFANGTELALSYAFTDGQDRFSAGTDDFEFMLRTAPLDGTIQTRRLARSDWAVPHRLTLLLTGNLPFGVKAAFFYEGLSGSGFAYGVNGDPNGDGSPQNDLAYVPADVRPGGDIELVNRDEDGRLNPEPSSTYARLDRLITSQPCLRSQRGRVMRRNSCRNPWVNHTELRLSVTLPIAQGRPLEIGVDAFNLLQLMNRRWGLVRGIDDPTLYQLFGYDTDRQRGMYGLNFSNRRALDIDASRWKLQLGFRLLYGPRNVAPRSGT